MLRLTKSLLFLFAGALLSTAGPLLHAQDDSADGWYMSFALDGAARPHYLYFDREIEHLRYASLQGNQWQVEEVPTGSELLALHTSLEVSAEGTAHVLYQRIGAIRTTLVHGERTAGGTWQKTELLDRGPRWDLTATLALGPQGEPAACTVQRFVDQPGREDLVYLRRDSEGRWQRELIQGLSTGERIGTDLRLRLDSTGRPAVVYTVLSGGRTTLYFARREADGSWSRRSIVAAAKESLEWSLSLAFDRTDTPHIIFAYKNGTVSNPDRILVYYVWQAQNGGWYGQSVHMTEAPAGVRAELRLDSADNPYIALALGMSSENDRIQLVLRNDEGQWVFTTVDSASRVNWNAALAVDTQGYLHLSYFDLNRRALQYNLLPLWQVHGETTFWSDAVDLGNGWRWLEWLGYFNVTYAPWILHDELGWLYARGESSDSVYFYSPTIGWLYTNGSTYPSLFRFDADAWVWYQRGSRKPAWLVNLETNQWFTLP